jgi:pilus assembly protein CpaB
MNSRQRRGLVLLLTAAILGVLTFVLVGGYVANVNAQVGERVTVYRLTRDVAAFRELAAADAEAVSVPRKWVGPADFTDDSYVGRQTFVAVRAGTFVAETHLIPANGLKSGEREIAINVDAEAGVAGRIAPGDFVNVNVTFELDDPKLRLSQVFIRRARVVAIGVRHSPAESAGAAREVVPVTFALSEADSLKLLYAESFAKTIRLSKVAAADTARPTGSRPYTNKEVQRVATGER